MRFFIIKAFTTSDLTNATKEVFLGTSINDDPEYYWMDEYNDKNICRFVSEPSALHFIETTKGFNTIVNTGTEIKLPYLLEFISSDKIIIEEMCFHEPITTVDKSSVVVDYINRRDEFRSALKDLKDI